jgi:hypothetical protein
MTDPVISIFLPPTWTSQNQTRGNEEFRFDKLFSSLKFQNSNNKSQIILKFQIPSSKIGIPNN